MSLGHYVTYFCELQQNTTSNCYTHLSSTTGCVSHRGSTEIRRSVTHGLRRKVLWGSIRWDDEMRSARGQPLVAPFYLRNPVDTTQHHRKLLPPKGLGIQLSAFFLGAMIGGSLSVVLF